MSAIGEEESIDSIIRDETYETDNARIRDELNQCIEGDTAIVGGGRKIFQPYVFQKDDPRVVFLCTIPYLLDEKCPVLKELVDIFGSTLDACRDVSKIDRDFVTKTQHLLDDLNHFCEINASCLDLSGAVELYMEERAHPAVRGNVKPFMRDALAQIRRKWNEYGIPAGSEDEVVMNLLFKLLRCIGGRLYRTSTDLFKLHNVFVMAYDTGADNRSFLARKFGAARPPVKTCVAFTSVDGLHRAITYKELSFEEEFEGLHDKIEEKTTEFLIYVQSRRVPDERSKLQELQKSLEKLSMCFKTMAEGGTFDPAEGKHIVESVDASMSYFTENENEGHSKASSDYEKKELRKSMVQMKKEMKEHVEKINSLIRYQDEAVSLQELLLKNKVDWEKSALTIDGYANGLKRQEERLRVIAECATKDMIMDEYEKCNAFGKICLRHAFPFIDGYKIKK